MSFWTKLFASLQSGIFPTVKQADLEKVKALLEGNPDLVSKKHAAGWTPLHYAAPGPVSLRKGQSFDIPPTWVMLWL